MDQVVDVFGVRRRAGHEPTERLAVAIVELTEGADLTSSQLSQELRIGCPLGLAA